ncbi:hypothetical protein ABIC55_004287 [Sporosarcina psychrophila]|uniref:Uncharacterized protein n=1 Tax=Sporosarcina psychrophila TaxID=1476 RepID=A0ABV2KDP9_SPOPS
MLEETEDVPPTTVKWFKIFLFRDDYSSVWTG